MKASDLLNLDRQFNVYRHYHQNATNRRIHALGVPMLVVTTLALLMAVPLPPPVVDLGRLTAALFAAYYIIMSPLVGLFFSPFVAGAYLAARYSVSGVGARAAVPIVLIFHVLAWVAQLVGHFMYEGKHPALVDGFLQTILAAPIVVFLDVAFSLGFAPELKKRIARSPAASKARKAIGKVVD